MIAPSVLTGGIGGLVLLLMLTLLFDLGAFTLDEDRQFLVSEKVVGTDGFDLWLVRVPRRHHQSSRADGVMLVGVY